MQPSDQSLVEQSAAGDTDAFALLVGRYQTLVCSIAYSITGDFSRSEDVGQDAFVAAWKQLAELQDRSRFKSWLCSITRNLAHNSMRGDKKLRFGDAADEAFDSAPSPAAAAAVNEETTLVWAALSRLPESYREPLVLFYRQDQSIAEVADALDVSSDVVKQRLSRGRKLLRDEVTSAIERTLKQTVPTRAFTLGVVAALSAMTSKTAVAASTGAAAGLAKAAAGTTAWNAGGLLGSVLGGVSGIAGGALGTWASWSTAKYQSQRDFIYRQTAIYVAGMIVFMLPFLAMGFGWRPQRQLGADGYLIAWGTWMTVFMTANFIWMTYGMRRWNSITRQAEAESAAELPSTPARRWISTWRGRNWTSRRTLLGRPLVHIAIAAPGSAMPGESRQNQETARGWIAIGDRARGLLLAVGNTAVAPIAIGTMSVGLVSFGVLSVGVLSFGVLAIGAASFAVVAVGGWGMAGAVAVAYLASGPVAIGWEAAKGAVAIAFHYADGAKAIAAHAGDEAAKRYFAESMFFGRAWELLEWTVSASRSPDLRWCVLIVAVLAIGLWLALYRRDKPSPPHSPPSRGS